MILIEGKQQLRDLFHVVSQSAVINVTTNNFVITCLFVMSSLLKGNPTQAVAEIDYD